MKLYDRISQVMDLTFRVLENLVNHINPNRDKKDVKNLAHKKSTSLLCSTCKNVLEVSKHFQACLSVVCKHGYPGCIKVVEQNKTAKTI